MKTLTLPAKGKHVMLDSSINVGDKINDIIFYSGMMFKQSIRILNEASANSTVSIDVKNCKYYFPIESLLEIEIGDVFTRNGYSYAVSSLEENITLTLVSAVAETSVEHTIKLGCIGITPDWKILSNINNDIDSDSDSDGYDEFEIINIVSIFRNEYLNKFIMNNEGYWYIASIDDYGDTLLIGGTVSYVKNIFKYSDSDLIHERYDPEFHEEDPDVYPFREFYLERIYKNSKGNKGTMIDLNLQDEDLPF